MNVRSRYTTPTSMTRQRCPESPLQMRRTASSFRRALERGPPSAVPASNVMLVCRRPAPSSSKALCASRVSTRVLSCKALHGKRQVRQVRDAIARSTRKHLLGLIWCLCCTDQVSLKIDIGRICAYTYATLVFRVRELALVLVLAPPLVLPMEAHNVHAIATCSDRILAADAYFAASCRTGSYAAARPRLARLRRRAVTTCCQGHTNCSCGGRQRHGS